MAIDSHIASLSPSASGAWPLRWRPITAPLLIFAGYYLGSKIGFALTFSPNPISVLWPPNAVLLAALLLAPMRAWPLLLLAAFPAHLIAQLQGSVPAAMVMCWFLSNASEALIGAVCVRRLIQRPLALDNVHEVAAFVACAAFLAPFLSSFLDAAFVELNGWGTQSYWALWKTRFFSNVLSAVTVIPVIVTIATAGMRELLRMVRSRLTEAAALAVGLLTAGVLVFDVDPSAVPTLALYLPVPFLVWAALRFGPAGASASFTATALVVIWGAAHGRGPFTAGTPAENALIVQLFLTLVGISTLTLAAFMHERKRMEQTRRSSEELFATAFRLSPKALAITRASDGRFIEVNQRWIELFGRGREEFVGRTVQELNVSGNKEAQARLGAVVADQSDMDEVELDLPNGRGKVIHGLIATRAVEIAGERCLVTSVGDDTERQRVQTALRESEAHFRSIAHAAPAMIWMSDTDQRITFSSKRWLDFTGQGPDQELGTSALYGVHTDDLERCRASYAEAFAARQAFELQFRQRRRDGVYRWILDSGVPRFAADGRFLGYIGSRVDITERHELQRTHQELAHIARISTMGELAASLAHELNQPLTAMLTNVQTALRMLAQNRIDVDELRAILQDVAEDDSRASEVIRRMRALASKGELEVAPLDLATVIREVAVLVQTDAIIRGVLLSMELEADLAVNGDKVQLQQVMLNLLLNAFEAVKDRARGERRVVVRAERVEGGMVRVAVSDNGSGLPGDMLDKIFRPFFTSKRGGLGLGLSISRSIIEAHGGQLRAANNEDGGATFHFRLSARTDANEKQP